MKNLQQTGTVAFKISHADWDWAFNDRVYKFGPCGDEKTLDVVAIKNADRTLEIRVAFEHWWHTFAGPTPTPSSSGEIHIAVTWDSKLIKLYVQGDLIASEPFGPVRH